MIAAPTGPTPYTSVTDVLDASTATAMRAFTSTSRAIESDDVVEQILGLLLAFRDHPVHRVDAASNRLLERVTNAPETRQE